MKGYYRIAAERAGTVSLHLPGMTVASLTNHSNFARFVRKDSVNVICIREFLHYLTRASNNWMEPKQVCPRCFSDSTSKVLMAT